MLPKMIKKFNAYFQDESWAGIFEEVTVGKIMRKTEPYRGAGMSAEVKIDIGYELPELSMTLKEYNSKLIRQWGNPEIDGTQLRLQASARSDRAGGGSDRIEIIFRGRPDGIDFGSMKAGTLTDMKLDYSVSYFKYVVNGETLVELDPVAGVEIVNGVDLDAEGSAAVSL